MFNFIDRSQPLLRAFVNEKDMFYYDKNKKLYVNKELANKNSVTIPLSFSRSIWISPIVVRDKDSNEELEGVVMCFDSSVNYVTLSYDEFRFLVYYMKTIDLESLALQLITFAELTKDRTFTKIDSLTTEQIPENNGVKSDKISGIGPVKKEEELPKI